MDKEIETLFDELATVTNRMRQRDAKNRKDKKKADALLAQVESIAKKNKHKVTTTKFVITFKNKKGGDYHVKPWAKYGLDKIVTL